MKKMILIQSLAGVLFTSSFVLLAQAVGTQVAETKNTKKPAKRTGTVQDPGEKAFQANCSRCHNAPEQLSPRISGTVVRHMRVRASLSAEDERLILALSGSVKVNCSVLALYQKGGK